MERIMVAMDPSRTHLFVVIHALSLARRINAKVFFLLVFPAAADQPGKTRKEEEAATVKRSVDALIDEARSDGITVDYYTAYGDYENELIRFVQENKVTLLVIEGATGTKDAAEDFKNFLDRLRHRINCRIEVVNEKPKHADRKE
jgi:nucleotide-binding universal stress UspA family protein